MKATNEMTIKELAQHLFGMNYAGFVLRVEIMYHEPEDQICRKAKQDVKYLQDLCMDLCESFGTYHNIPFDKFCDVVSYIIAL